MFVVLGVIVTVIGLLMIWFNIAYSPMKKQFDKDIQRLKAENKLEMNAEVFTEKDFEHQPEAIRKYIQGSGFIGKPKMSYLNMEYKDVDFKTGKNGAKMKMDYTQYNFAKEPCRMAFDDAGLFGVPFQGYDYYENGKGGMKGVIAKLITLFDQTGEDMDKACLATYLAESLFLPTSLLQGHITFEQVSEFRVRGTAEYKGQKVSGIFTFNEKYEMISFVTEDRVVSGSDGKKENIPWTALCSDYEVSDDGLNLPTTFKAVWNYPDGDFIYFDGKINSVSYG